MALELQGIPLGQCGLVERHDTFLTPHRADPGALNVDLDISSIRTDGGSAHEAYLVQTGSAKGGENMFFVVTGQGFNGLVAVTCETAAAAVEKARALIADGVLDVLIADADGRQHPPGDFHRLLLGIQPGGSRFAGNVLPGKALVEERLSHLATRRFPNLAIGDTCVSHVTARIGFIFLAVSPAWAQTHAPGATPGSPPAGATGGGIMDFGWVILLAVIIAAAVWYFSRGRNRV